METQHSDWLRQLAAERKGGVALPSITRGEAYETIFNIPIDVSADTFTAALSIAPDAPTLASFGVTVGEWDGEYTTVTITLSEATVGTLPVDADANGLTELVFSVNQNGARLFAGHVFISGEV
ncbi:hypothetical protein [Qipengyuania flava]|uniref:hypothetical protein n=1 Tax=Qipengyuania flava TaxID=192812 RepID=UPI0012FDD6F3|nr:hypothetical protein [Qipengyuania flava]